ncbi:MAG: type IX secretion system sortase PorU [Paludibacter sp.]
MKFKIILLTLISICVSTLSAQTEETSHHELNWTGIEKWVADSSSVNVISFTGAKYPAENRLPYFNKRISCDKAFSYQAEIKNPVFIPLTNEEKTLTTGIYIPLKEEILTTILTERLSSFLDINILPFINRSGEIVKLKSFDLVIRKTTAPQKATSAVSRTYSTASVLALGKFVKLRISETGVYKITYEDLNSMGVDPQNARVFGYGGGILDQNFQSTKLDDLPEVAIWQEKGSDGVFNAGDYILFYGQGPTKWTYDKSKSMFTHTINHYSKYGYYFVSSNAGIGKKIIEKTITVPNSPTINTIDEFVDYDVHEKDSRNLTSSGKEFYGEIFNNATSYNLTFNFPNPVAGNTISARLDVAASSSAISEFQLTLNGGQTKSLLVGKKTEGDNYEQAKAANSIFTFSPISGAFSFNLAYPRSTSTSVGYLNYLEVNSRRQLKMAGSVMRFQNVDYLGTESYNQYQLSGAGNNIKIWDITDQQNITQMPTTTSNAKMIFTDSANEIKNYIAIDPTAKNSFSTPEVVGIVPNQNLHGIAQADMIIITHPDFLPQSQTLAQAHREKDNLTVEVVTTEQVYNEFSSGTPDATAYRWVMKMLYDRAIVANNTKDLPKYLLLFGKGSFDNRKITSNSGDNLVLTYEAENSLSTTLSYVTDDYFALLDDNEGTQVPSNLMDIGVGRFTVSTQQQATNVVNKTIAYMNNQEKGNWKNQICFVADDGDGALHMKQADSIAVSIARNYPAYQVNKIYLDAYNQEVTASGERYPLAKNQLMNLIRSGLFLLNYTGHAGPTGWSNESILTAADVKSFSNKNLPLWVAATCDFVQFDVQTQSAGEQVVFNPTGGGIGIFAAARPVYASQNFTLDKLFCENLFKRKNGEHLRVGDIIASTKNSIGSEINKLSYVYVGDPALKLNYPTKYNIITSKINESTILGNDTLKALSVANIQGFIADNNGSKIETFNGSVHIVVYDKVQRITTLNNDKDGNMTYSNRPSMLFSGNAVVKNGTFSFSFMLPKDIKYNYGGGRINYYAQDDVNNDEAQGYFENFIIGGTNKNSISETDGPAVELFLNSENFTSGSKVNETPLFIANVSDINGINTVGGSGIGHEVTVTIDQDPLQSYILNDYFVADKDSYTSGSVRYKLPEMKNGKHTLTFRAWDLLNNSTTSTIDFEVEKGLTPTIFKVYNYPNPAKTQTSIIVEHDRPETVLSTSVEIFDLAGRKVWSFSQPSADKISWDLITSDGPRVKTGIYLYRVNIKTANSDTYSKTNKMLIVEQ